MQPFIQMHIKENIKAPRHWPLCGEFTGAGEFPAQMASNAENVSIWWCHHVYDNKASYISCAMQPYITYQSGILLIHSYFHICVVLHYSDVIMSAMASQITSILIVYWNICSGADQRKHQSSASLAFVRRIHRSPVNSPHKGSVTRKMFTFDDVSMSRMKYLEVKLISHNVFESMTYGLYIRRDCNGITPTE